MKTEKEIRDLIKLKHKAYMRETISINKTSIWHQIEILKWILEEDGIIEDTNEMTKFNKED